MKNKKLFEHRIEENGLALLWSFTSTRNAVQYCIVDQRCQDKPITSTFPIPLRDRSFLYEMTTLQTISANESRGVQLSPTNRLKKEFQEKARQTYQTLQLVSELYNQIKTHYPNELK